MAERRSVFPSPARLRAMRDDLRAARVNSDRLIEIATGLRAQLEQSWLGLTTLQGEVETRAAALEQRVAALEQTLGDFHGGYDRLMLALRMVRDDEAGSMRRLEALRLDPAYERSYADPEPLVSVLVPTYSNWRLMRERCLPSILGQTYENWECIVVGDAAPPEAEAAVASFGDRRLSFTNLPYRGPYPPRREDAWLVSGTAPLNAALRLARGRWIVIQGDDDHLVPTHLESLLGLARRERAEVAYGLARIRFPDREDEIMGTAPPPQLGMWDFQASLFHSGLSQFPLLPSDWVFSVPNDWSWADRMLRIGVRFAMLDEVMCEYFPSLYWKDRPTPPG